MVMVSGRAVCSTAATLDYGTTESNLAQSVELESSADETRTGVEMSRMLRCWERTWMASKSTFELLGTLNKSEKK